MANQAEVLNYLYKRKDEWISLSELKEALGARVGVKLSKLIKYDLISKKYVNEFVPVKRPTTRGYKTTITTVYYKFKKF